MVDRSQPLTQIVLKSCYRPAGATLTWTVEQGVRVAAWREPVEVSRTGRGGEYFVHALVGDAEGLTEESLGRLWGAEGWQSDTPDLVPDSLPPLSSIEEFGLARPYAIDDDTLLALAGGLVANARDFWISGIDFDSAAACAYAAAIGGLLPGRHRPLPFCSHPEDAEVNRFTIVGGASDAPKVRVLDPDAVDPLDLAVADLLMAFREGDRRALDVVGVIDDRSPDLAALAVGLRHWTRLDRRPGSPGALAASDALDFVAAEPRLVSALARGEGRWLLADAVAEALPGTAEFVHAMEQRDELGSIDSLVVERMQSLPAASAVDRLVELWRGAPEAAATVAAALVDAAGRAWLDSLDGRKRAVLAEVLGAELEPRADVVVDPSAAPGIVASRLVADSIRATTVARYPRTLTARAVARLFEESPFALRTVVAHARTIEWLDEVIAVIDPVLGFRTVVDGADVVPPDRVEGWQITLLRRMSGRDRYEAAAPLARGRGANSALFVDLAIDGFEDWLLTPHDAVVASIDGLFDLLSSLWQGTARSDRWRTAVDRSSLARSSEVAMALSHLRAVVAEAVVVQRLRRAHWSMNWQDWRGLVDRELSIAAAAGIAGIWSLLARSATELPRHASGQSAVSTPRTFVVRYLAHAIADKQLTGEDLRGPDVARVREQLSRQEWQFLWDLRMVGADGREFKAWHGFVKQALGERRFR